MSRHLRDVQQCGQYLALATVEARDIEVYDVLSSGLVITETAHTASGHVWLWGRYMYRSNATLADPPDTRIYAGDAGIRVLVRI